MNWKINPPGTTPQEPGWLPSDRIPKPRAVPKRITPAGAKRKSAYTSREQIHVAMSEAVLRALILHPAAIAGTAHAIQLRPRQTREAHFEMMMDAISGAAPNYPGLGEAIAAALEPFAKDPIWESGG